MGIVRSAVSMATMCDIPYCDNTTHNGHMFDQDNIKCWECNHTYCKECTDKLWTNVNATPVCGMTRQVFKCPFCRADFDRIVFNED